MTTLSIRRMVCANIAYKPLSAFFNMLLMALGVAVLLGVSHLNDQMARRFAQDLKGIDLVVGAKGSPLQVILSSVFQIDTPTGNIPLDAANKLAANPMIAEAIPMALGDNFHDHRIVGTTPAYAEHYGAKIAEGRMYAQQMEAVVGWQVAMEQHVKVGDSLVGAHGLSGSGDLHANTPYRVTGILAATGGVVDRLVLTPVESVWFVHEHPDPDDHDEEAEAARHGNHPREITAMLIRYKTPLAAAMLPRLINHDTVLQAASPAFETARMVKLLDAGSDLMAAVGAGLVLLSALGLFVAFYNAVHERRYDIALMRGLGAARGYIFRLVLAETALLALVGAALGLLLSQGLAMAGAAVIAQQKGIYLPPPAFGLHDLAIAAGAAALGVLAGVVPAWLACRTAVTQTLGRL